MENVKKMSLVQYDFISHHNITTSPVNKSLTSMDREMDNILVNPIIAEDEKLKMYNQVLHKYLSLQGKKN